MLQNPGPAKVEQIIFFHERVMTSCLFACDNHWILSYDIFVLKKSHLLAAPRLLLLANLFSMIQLILSNLIII